MFELFSFLGGDVYFLWFVTSLCIFKIGTAQFLRTEMTAQHHHAFGARFMGQPGLVASVSGSVGILRPILNGMSNSGSAANQRHGVAHLSDRYFGKL